jgi:hypothetical protein
LVVRGAPERPKWEHPSARPGRGLFSMAMLGMLILGAFTMLVVGCLP